MEPQMVDLLEHQGFVRAVVRGLLADEHAVDDVVQETCLRALERPPRAMRAWLARVARNLALTARRREKTRDRRERGAARPERQPSAGESASLLERHRLVVEAVLALEEPFRSAILLRFYDDLPPRAIARELNVPVETARSRVRRGLERLRAHLDARHGGDRAAWSLALLPLAGSHAMKVVTGGALMGAKAKVSVVAVLLCVAAVGTLTWQAISERHRASSPRSESARRVADAEGASGAEGATAKGGGGAAPDAAAPKATAAVPGAVPEAAGPFAVAPTEEPVPWRLAEATGDALGALRVVVEDDAGNGVASAKIMVGFKRTGGQETFVTGPDGRVELRSLEPGKLSVAVSLAGRYRSATAEVSSGRFTELTVVFERGATVEGEVRHVERGPLPDIGVAVELPRRDGFDEWFRAITDQEGRYRIEGVPTGTHAVVVWGGILGQWQFPRATLTVPGPGTTVTKDIVVGRVALRGTVRDAATLGPIPEVRLAIHHPPQWNCDATTDAYGCYEVRDLPPGDYRVDLVRDGYGLVVSRTGEIPPEGTRTTDFALPRAAALALKLMDQEGRPIPGRHLVTMIEPGGPSLTFQIEVDETGVGRHARVLPGTYDLTLSVPGHATKTERIVVAPGENRLTLTLEPAASEGRVSLQGTVRDATTNEPIAGVHLRLYEPLREASTGQDGVYRFRDVKPGKFILIAERDGYGARQLVDTAVGADGTTFDITLDRAATLRLLVTDRSGSPVAGRLGLIVVGRGERKTDFGTEVVADALGQAVYERIVPGPYWLVVSKPGIGEAKVEAEITAGENLVRAPLE